MRRELAGTSASMGWTQSQVGHEWICNARKACMAYTVRHFVRAAQ
jgi:hypothetical protein